MKAVAWVVILAWITPMVAVYAFAMWDAWETVRRERELNRKIRKDV